jgi:hypothetical protein
MFSVSENALFQSTLRSEATFDSAREPKIASFDTELALHYQATPPRPNDSIRALSGGLTWLARFRQCCDGQERPGRLKPALNWKKTLASRPMPNLQTLRKILQRWAIQKLLTNYESTFDEWTETMTFFLNHLRWGDREVYLCASFVLLFSVQ